MDETNSEIKNYLLQTLLEPPTICGSCDGLSSVLASNNNFAVQTHHTASITQT
eukprot:m.263465 g.263465  ORF g.263465 m.263465 type:complete len:53 (+) comp50547_c0_seq1:1112-1270(+)